MKKKFIFRALSLFIFSFICFGTNAQGAKPDTISIGIYITSIHDIDFKQKEYTVNFWIWLKYKNKEFDFYNNLEIELTKPHTEYSSFRIRLVVNREASGLFWKMFLGMYIAFLISYVCFYIHADGMDSRFGLGVGSLFAVIGNKYIIDSALPESSSFTLVDLLHGITLFFIFATIAANAYSLNLIKKDKVAKAYKFDTLASRVVLIAYVLLNIWFIWRASKG